MSFLMIFPFSLSLFVKVKMSLGTPLAPPLLLFWTFVSLIKKLFPSPFSLYLIVVNGPYASEEVFDAYSNIWTSWYFVSFEWF